MDGFVTSKFRLFALVAIATLSLGLAGCGGSDGDDGAAGAPGAPGSDGSDGLACWDLNGNGVPDFPDEDTNGDGVIDVFDCRTPPIAAGIDISNDAAWLLIDEFVAVIDDVTIESPPIVQFTLTDGNGTPIIGLAETSSSPVRGTFVKLMPEANGMPGQWTSYINRIEEGGSGDTPDVLPQSVQATNDGAGTLTDLGGGVYTYEFSIDVMNVTEPVEVLWEPGLTHKLGLEIRLEDPNTGVDEDPLNPVWQFVPDGSDVTDTKSIANLDSCNACHQKLAIHGDHRNNTEYCVTCHNPGTIDQDTADSVDMAYMTHSIHVGEARAAAGFPYVIYGFRDSPHDYSHVVFPGDIRNCESCHAESADTPDGDDWKAQSGVSQCGGCHIAGVNVVARDAVTGWPTYSYIHTAIGGFEAADGACVTCHVEGGAAGATEDFHVNEEALLAEQFSYNVLDATNTGPGEFPVITFSITDPTNGDAAYDVCATGGPWDTAMWDGDTRLAVMLAWDTVDYNNWGTGSEVAGFRPGSPAQNVSINPLADCAGADNGDGTYTVTSTVAVPDWMTGTLAASVEGHPAVDTDGDGTPAEVPVTGAVGYFPITDGAAVERREVVSIDQCNACHQKLSFHGGNRTDNIDLCVTCHNANATDIRARAEALAPPFGGPPTFVDGDKHEESIDFKRMIHQIHAGNVVLYGFGGGRHDYSHVEYPADIADCGVCHSGDTFYPVDSSVLASTIYADPTMTDPRTPEREAALAMQIDDLNTTATAAACSSCHTSDFAGAHMEQNGAVIADVDLGIATQDPMTGALTPAVVETCAICHGAGGVSDTAEAHGN